MTIKSALGKATLAVGPPFGVVESSPCLTGGDSVSCYLPSSSICVVTTLFPPNATQYLRKTVFKKSTQPTTLASTQISPRRAINRSPDVDTAHNFASNEPGHIRTINRLPNVGTAHDVSSNKSAHVRTINRSPDVETAHKSHFQTFH
jgi:hypothetical protein